VFLRSSDPFTTIISVSYSFDRNFAFTSIFHCTSSEYMSGLMRRSDTNTILPEVTIVLRKCDCTKERYIIRLIPINGGEGGI
jgi:hypothetical protein